MHVLCLLGILHTRTICLTIPCSALSRICTTLLLPLSAILLVRTELGFVLFAPALPGSSCGVCACLEAGSPPPLSLDVQCVLRWKKLLCVDCSKELRCCLQRDSSLLISSVFLLDKNFMYTGSEWVVAGKWCALAKLLPRRAPEYDLYKNHIYLCRGSSLSQLYGLPSLMELTPVWTQAASVNASKHFWETRWIFHMALFHTGCISLLLCGVS